MFAGAYTALITPFQADGKVDFGKLRELVELQVAGGIDGVVPVGTTGESPTLDFDEHLEVIRVVTETAGGRMQVIAGTGANSTDEALELTRRAMDFGVNGTLQVTPYYNKPTPTGLIRHFSAVADLGLPVVLYNVPGRCSCEIGVGVIAELARHPHVVCVKEAGGSVDRVSKIRAVCDIEILSGDDALTLPMMAVARAGSLAWPPTWHRARWPTWSTRRRRDGGTKPGGCTNNTTRCSPICSSKQTPFPSRPPLRCSACRRRCIACPCAT